MPVFRMQPLEQIRSTVGRQFCDTDFVERDGVVGDEFRTAEALPDRLAVTWPPLDHGYLKVIEGLERQTLENIIQWVWQKIDLRISGPDKLEVRRGTCGHGCVYRAN